LHYCSVSVEFSAVEICLESVFRFGQVS